MVTVILLFNSAMISLGDKFKKLLYIVEFIFAALYLELLQSHFYIFSHFIWEKMQGATIAI
jgi:hypothetical protein